MSVSVCAQWCRKGPSALAHPTTRHGSEGPVGAQRTYHSCRSHQKGPSGVGLRGARLERGSPRTGPSPKSNHCRSGPSAEFQLERCDQKTERRAVEIRWNTSAPATAGLPTTHQTPPPHIHPSPEAMTAMPPPFHPRLHVSHKRTVALAVRLIAIIARHHVVSLHCQHPRDGGSLGIHPFSGPSVDRRADSRCHLEGG